MQTSKTLTYNEFLARMMWLEHGRYRTEHVGERDSEQDIAHHYHATRKYTESLDAKTSRNAARASDPWRRADKTRSVGTQTAWEEFCTKQYRKYLQEVEGDWIELVRELVIEEASRAVASVKQATTAANNGSKQVEFSNSDNSKRVGMRHA